MTTKKEGVLVSMLLSSFRANGSIAGGGRQLSFLKRLFAVGIIALPLAVGMSAIAKPGTGGAVTLPGKLSLAQCIEIALENNHARPASRLSVEIAQIQHKQVMSAYWPRMMLNATYAHLDESPNFLFPSTTVVIPPGVFGSTAMLFPTPEQDVQLMDPDTGIVSGNFAWLLYDGGMRRAMTTRTECGVDAARQDARRTDLKVVYDVKRMYYSSVLARRVHEIGEDTLARMELTLELTENLYKKGSGKVKKTDYLRNKVVVEGIRSGVASLEKNVELAESALVYSMGLPWATTIELSASEIPFAPYHTDLEKLVGRSYQFNPDWAQLAAGLKAAEAKIDQDKSAHFPKVALTGSLTYLINSYDYGLATEKNKETWTIGVGLQLPIFEGFLTRNRIKEARARLGKLQHQKVLLREGIALQVRQMLLNMTAAQKQQAAGKAAHDAALANLDLTERAYQAELLETQDLISAQLMESFVAALYVKSLYDHADAQAHLDLVVGTEVQKQLKDVVEHVRKE